MPDLVIGVMLGAGGMGVPLVTLGYFLLRLLGVTIPTVVLVLILVLLTTGVIMVGTSLLVLLTRHG